MALLGRFRRSPAGETAAVEPASQVPPGGSLLSAFARTSERPRGPEPTVVAFDLGSVWRATWVVIAVMALTAILRFFFADGAEVLFTVVMAFFMSVALEPAVAPLSRFMPRPLAAGIVLVALLAASVAFLLSFGGMMRDQVLQLVTAAPQFVTDAIAWVNATFGTKFDVEHVLSQANLDTGSIATAATTVAGGLLGIVNSVASAAFNTFTFLFFTFYLAADAPRLRTWIAQLFPPREQVVVLTLYELTLTKVGGYVAARLVLAGICGTCTAVFLRVIDLPGWLPLGIWTGVVAQFVPTIGTYLAIALPVLVGLLGPNPQQGLYALLFALVYQQIENVTIEPRISAKAVDVHPAVSFASAMLGAALFGVSGALVGVPVAATLIAIFDIYKQRYEVSSVAEQRAIQAATRSESGAEGEQAPLPDAEPLPAAAPPADPAAPPS